MDRDEALKLLTGGEDRIAEWNRRRSSGEVIPDLSRADLHRADLRWASLGGANFRGANLREANLSMAGLRGANLNGARLIGAHLFYGDLCVADLRRAILIEATLTGANLNLANLRGADLREAHLSEGNLTRADFRLADLTGANLTGANFSEADLRWANLTGGRLVWANLNEARLSKANLSAARCRNTGFADLELSEVIGLESVEHLGPSCLGIGTLIRSNGKIPEVFLKGCGVPDLLIQSFPLLIASMSPSQFYLCFISYNSTDRPLAERLYADLQSKGVRCWCAPEGLKIEEGIRVGIDRSIRVHDKLLLILSENSIHSHWVEKEVETTMVQELRLNRTVLFPICLDDAVMKIDSGWPADIRRSGNIGDFRQWKDHDAYQKSFDRLLRDLRALKESN
jgi:uncharacterized protein YjbI with pentapeptide repeats